MPAHSPWKMDCSLGRTITVPQSHGIAKGSGVHRYSCRESPVPPAKAQEARFVAIKEPSPGG